MGSATVVLMKTLSFQLSSINTRNFLIGLGASSIVRRAAQPARRSQRASSDGRARLGHGGRTVKSPQIFSYVPTTVPTMSEVQNNPFPSSGIDWAHLR